jgi:hypothetical protein
MGGFDNATWQALGLLLTLLGLVVSALVWARKGPARGLRAAAWSLLPLAAGLTGVLRLGWDVTDLVLQWAARLVFSPMVWLGLAVASISFVLFVVSGFLLRRGGQQPPPERGKAVSGRRRAVGSGGSGAEQGSQAGRESTKAGSGAGAGELDDLADIEEILRKHGIT